MKWKSESEVTQLCPTLSDPMDCSLPVSSIHGIFQARVLEWVNGHQLELTPGESEGQGRLACCSPWGHKESEMTEQQNNNQNLGQLLCRK